LHQDLNGDGTIGVPGAPAQQNLVSWVNASHGAGLNNTAQLPNTSAVTADNHTFLFRAASDPIWNTGKEGNFELDTLAESANQPTAALNDAQAFCTRFFNPLRLTPDRRAIRAA